MKPIKYSETISNVSLGKKLDEVIDAMTVLNEDVTRLATESAELMLKVDQLIQVTGPLAALQGSKRESQVHPGPEVQAPSRSDSKKVQKMKGKNPF